MEPESKTQRKREAARLQQLGRSLTELNPQQRDSLDLPDALHTAIADYLRFPTREARRRQLQFIGKLMRELDADAIQAALDDLEGQSAAARYAHHQLETWRDRLLTEEAALTEYLEAFPDTDRQQLRLLLRRAGKAGSETEQKASARALFRFLRDSQPV